MITMNFHDQFRFLYSPLKFAQRVLATIGMALLHSPNLALR
jgi:hypothetical protein